VGTSVAWEAVVNYEILPDEENVSALGPFDRSAGPGLSGPFPVFSSLFNAAKPLLNDAVQLDFSEGGPSTTRTRLGKGRIASGMRSRMRAHNLLVVGSGTQNMSGFSNEIKNAQESNGMRVETNEEVSETSSASSSSTYDNAVRAAAVAAGATGVITVLDNLRRYRLPPVV